jgi:hypothetical protein
MLAFCKDVGKNRANVALYFNMTKEMRDFMTKSRIS